MISARMGQEIRLLAVAIALSIAAAAAGGAHASLFFSFSPTHAAPGDKVIIRTGGTPTSFGLADRVRPFQAPVRLYLVPKAVATSVRSGTDPRITYIGTLVPDKNGHGVLMFRVPQLPVGMYATAAWCPGCAAYSRGRTFFTFPNDPHIVPRYRTLMFLRIEPGGSPFRWWWIVPAVALLIAVGGTFVVRTRAIRSAQRSSPR